MPFPIEGFDMSARLIWVVCPSETP